MGALGAGIAAPLLYAALLVLPLVWWTDPRYIVPAVAAMLPPAISCASAGLAAVFSELLQGEHWSGGMVCCLSGLKPHALVHCLIASMARICNCILHPAGRERVERALAFGASRHEAGKVIVKLGVRAALQRLMQHTGGPGLLLLPALAAGLLLAGVPPMLVKSCCGNAPCQQLAMGQQLLYLSETASRMPCQAASQALCSTRQALNSSAKLLRCRLRATRWCSCCLWRRPAHWPRCWP